MAIQSFSIWRHAASRRGSALQECLRIASQTQAYGASFSSAASDPSAAGPVGRGPVTALLHAASGLLSRGPPAYPGHIPLSPVQHAALAALAALGAAADPRRADLVAAVGETTGLSALRALRDRMAASEPGRLVLAERPRVTDASVAAAWDMPHGTFGAAYASFMGQRGFRADERPPVRYVDDPELAYIIARLREVHDFWHVLFGCHTNVFGEVALKAVELVQTGLPMAGMAVAAGAWRLKSEDRAVLGRVYLPWALRSGGRCADLATLYYEHHLHEPLEALRMRWRIEPAPQAPQNEMTQRTQQQQQEREGEEKGPGPGPGQPAPP